MRFDDIFDVMGAIVLVGMITAIVSRQNSARVVTAFGRSFSGAISAALGR